jgi:hypothetical protein
MKRILAPVLDQDETGGLPMITYALGWARQKRGQGVYGPISRQHRDIVFFVLCTGAVFIAAAKMLQAVEFDAAFGYD